MLGAAIIVFREVLEAALIVGIVMAASAGAPRRGFWIASGSWPGSPAPGWWRCSPPSIAAAASGIGQELLNAAILSLAVAMLGWHNIWMSRHGRELAATARAVRRRGNLGSSPALCPGGGGRSRRVARGLGDGVVPLRHRRGRRSVAWLADRRRRARSRRRRCDRDGALSRAAAHPDSAAVHGDELDGAAARRRHGGAGRRVSCPGRYAAAAWAMRSGTLRRC